MCVDLYTHSPDSYAKLSVHFPLPSGKHLLRYKNFIDQKPGIQPPNLEWMYLESKRRNISAVGRSGFLIFDEVSIQVSVTICLHILCF